MYHGLFNDLTKQDRIAIAKDMRMLDRLMRKHPPRFIDAPKRDDDEEDNDINLDDDHNPYELEPGEAGDGRIVRKRIEE
jgi:hypothetical protein